eukprot:COSAG01_NODE_31389_length_598_cov_2.733467_2_plen_147_part_00
MRIETISQVVQLYIKQPAASVPAPRVRLGAFRRVAVPAGDIAGRVSIVTEMYLCHTCSCHEIFRRAVVPAGGTVTVTLRVSPEAHSVVTSNEGGEAIYYASADQQVEAGTIELHVGGGQPDYYAGSLSAKAAISASAPLSSCSAAP